VFFRYRPYRSGLASPSSHFVPVNGALLRLTLYTLLYGGLVARISRHGGILAGDFTKNECAFFLTAGGALNPRILCGNVVVSITTFPACRGVEKVGESWLAVERRGRGVKASPCGMMAFFALSMPYCRLFGRVRL